MATLTRAFELRPFHTNIIYSNFPSSALLCFLGIKKLSNMLTFVRDSDVTAGTSNPLGVKFVYDSTSPHIECGKLTKDDDSK